MKFESALIGGVLLRRYKRFLADVQLVDGEVITVHCPNTGAMTGCAEPGMQVWCSVSDNPGRKYRHTLEVTCLGDDRIVVNTGRANQVITEALRERLIPAFAEYETVRNEVPAPDGDSRFDVKLSRSGGPDCFIEIKSMTMLGVCGVGYFPDAISARALKHVESLVRARSAGFRAALIFCVQHTGIHSASIAGWIDPRYRDAVVAARDSGVEVMACATRIEREQICFDRLLPFHP